MPTFKCTWFFQSAKYNVGWTESWWTSATDAPTAAGQVSLYKTKRAALMSDAASVVTLRVSSVDHPRDSYFESSGYPVVGTQPEATVPIAGVWDALLMRRDISTYSLLGHIFLHMVPAGIFTGRTYVDNPATPSGWQAARIAYTNEITAIGTYLLRKVVATVPTYVACTYMQGLRRTERRLGRPFDALHGRRAVA